jgi:hypothetical protein
LITGVAAAFIQVRIKFEPINPDPPVTRIVFCVLIPPVFSIWYSARSIRTLVALESFGRAIPPKELLHPFDFFDILITVPVAAGPAQANFFINQQGDFS